MTLDENHVGADGESHDLTPEPQVQPESRNELEQSAMLVQRYQDAGDAEVLGELFTRYYDRVRRIVRVNMSPALQARVEPDDLVNSAMAKAFQIFERFEYREPASLINWLAAIALNKVRDRARKFDRRAEMELEALCGGGTSSAGFEPSASQTSPPDRVEREELRALVDECIARLSDEHREVILMRDYEGGSWRYVGERMGRSDKAAHMLYVRAKMALVSELRREGVK
jgi:RNA polymerase sigma-70 factor, ECF subfamily